MKRLHAIAAVSSALASLLAVGLLAVVARADEVDTLPAQAAAREWLAVVDGGAYGTGWDRSAEFLRKSVSREAWEKALAAAREPLGAVGRRKVRSVTYARNLPNAPQGEYVVIQYETQFEARPAVETVTPMREPDGAWRVSGYFVR